MGTKSSALFRCTISKRLVLFCVALLAMAVLVLGVPQATFAQGTCLQESSGIKNLQCTSNDVRIAAITAVRNLDGTTLSTCNIGVRYTFVMTATLTVGSTSSRSNVGMYFAQDNQAGDGGKNGGGATTGSCWRDVIPPVDFSANAFCVGPADPFPYCTGNLAGTSSVILGSSTNPAVELDAQPDNCGDGNAGTSQTINILAEDILCEPDATNHLRLPTCLSWQIPGGTIQCNTSAPTYPWVAAAIPPNPSKCNCNVLSVPVIVQHAAISVTKSATVQFPTNHDGSPADYTVVVTNTSNLGGVTINQLCDNKYGNIATAAGNACAAGTLCPSLCTASGTPFAACTGNGTGNFAAGSTCATNISCSLPATLSAPGNSVTCTFTGQIPENSTITDIVTANGVDSNIPPNPVSNSATADATAGDAPATATLTKTTTGAVHGCATLRYTAKIHNSSGATTDENLLLSALGDSAFTDLTSLSGDDHTNNSVVGTTCGQPVAGGLGTLSGSSGAGSFSAASPASIAVGGDYTCQFDGVICGTLTTITKPDGSPCTGIQHTNTLQPTLTGDEATQTVSQSGGTLVVSECFDTFTP